MSSLLIKRRYALGLAALETLPALEAREDSGRATLYTGCTQQSYDRSPRYSLDATREL